MKVLIVDDDPDMVDVTSYVLRRDGFSVAVAREPFQALDMWERDRPDVVLLDVRLPKRNGFSVLQAIRQKANTPVIMVSASDHEDSIVRGLQLGADDYVTKPFSPRQLTARIRSVLRRANGAAPPPGTSVEACGMVLNLDSHQLERGDLRVRLTPIEFRLLHLLMAQAVSVVSLNSLVDRAWGLESGDSYMLKTHMTHIRKKLRMEPGDLGYIESVPRVGYTLRMAS